MNWYEFMLRNRSEVFERSLEHMGLVGASAMRISLPPRVMRTMDLSPRLTPLFGKIV